MGSGALVSGDILRRGALRMDLDQIRRLVIISVFSDDVLVDRLVLKGGNALEIA